MSVLLLYIDPGSGSYLVQVIIAAILGGLFYFKNLWRRFKAFFTRGGKEGHPEDGSGHEPPHISGPPDASAELNAPVGPDASKKDHETR
ncbi:MAG TPA: hypothetical protein VK563_18205 [Puia sp.]|nr:hypothetical protein [Puia sp.]